MWDYWFFHHDTPKTHDWGYGMWEPMNMEKHFNQNVEEEWNLENSWNYGVLCLYFRMVILGKEFAGRILDSGCTGLKNQRFHCCECCRQYLFIERFMIVMSSHCLHQGPLNCFDRWPPSSICELFISPLIFYCYISLTGKSSKDPYV